MARVAARRVDCGGVLKVDTKILNQLIMNKFYQINIHVSGATNTIKPLGERNHGMILS
jgi:hypothetical protein